MSSVIWAGAVPRLVVNGQTLEAPEYELTDTMAISFLAPAILAGAVAAAIGLAPAAAAEPKDSPTDPVASAESTQRGPNAAKVKPRPAPNSATTDYSSSQIPQGWRNDALWAKPGTPGSNPFGSGKRPPVIALD